jgi:uncharacterized protein (DUF697 family)
MTEAVLPASEFNVSSEKEQSVLSQSEGATRKNRAIKTVKTYVLLSGGVGFIPMPLFDQVAIAGLSAKMLSDLCQIYNVKFSEHKIKAIVASVLGGAHSEWITGSVVFHFSRFIPGISLITKPVISGTIIYAIGRLFVHHFESRAWR